MLRLELMKRRQPSLARRVLECGETNTATVLCRPWKHRVRVTDNRNLLFNKKA